MVKHRNLSEQLLHELGEQIINGEIAPGEVLPKVETISELHGVSRTVVREALKGLSARNLIESSTKTGTAVRPRDDWQWWNPDVLAWASMSQKSQDILLQLTEVRLAIEPAAVKLAAEKATDQDLVIISNCFKKMEKSIGDDKKWAEADYEFHNSILVASHNELMLSLIKTLHKGLVLSRETTIKVLKGKNDENNMPKVNVLSMHKEVMEAILARDSRKAYEKMYHLLQTVITLIEEFHSKM